MEQGASNMNGFFFKSLFATRGPRHRNDYLTDFAEFLEQYCQSAQFYKNEISKNSHFSARYCQLHSLQEGISISNFRKLDFRNLLPFMARAMIHEHILFLRQKSFARMPPSNVFFSNKCLFRES